MIFNYNITKNIVASVLVCSVSYSCFAQLHISENTNMYVGEAMVSYEKLNNINSDVEGQGVLIFKADHVQGVHASSSISLPHLKLQNPVGIHIDANFKIREDFIIEHSHLQLYQPLVIEGEYLKDELSLIIGEELVITTSTLKSFPLSLPISQNTFVDHNLTPAVVMPSPTAHIVIARKTSILNYKGIHSFLLALGIPTPPPEC